MSRELAMDCINLTSGGRLGHTEYSLGYHLAYIRRLTGCDDPGSAEASRRLHSLWGIDFLWGTNDGLYADWSTRGRCMDMGHAVYAADGSDQHAPSECPFREPEDVWAFDAVAEYGLPSLDEQAAAYEGNWQASAAANPGQLVTGGYYRTLVSGAIQAFGWDLFLVALADYARMEPVLDSFFRRTLFHMQAWSRTSAPVIIQHDDFVWTEGAFMPPDYYRRVVIPRYAELWKPLHAAGKKVLFCSDGDFTEFAADIVAAGADGLIFEPVNDFGWMAERFGDAVCLIGSGVDCRDLTFGRWSKVQADIDRTFEAARGCRGVIFATGNHLPANIPEDMMDRYIAHLLCARAAGSSCR